MKRTYKYLQAILFPTTIFFACKKNNPAAVDGPFVVKLYNCNADKNSSSPYICFDSLITDSRCPANAICIWSGFAAIKVSFHENGNAHSFKMSTINKLVGVNDTTINGYKLIFTALTPYPGTGSTDDIKATIEITK